MSRSDQPRSRPAANLDDDVLARPDSVAGCTCAMEAAASGVRVEAGKQPRSTGRPNAASTAAAPLLGGNGGTASWSFAELHRDVGRQ